MAWYDAVGDFLMGQDPRDVRSPAGVQRAQEARAGLMAQFQGQATGEVPSQAEQALGLAGRLQAEQLAQRQQSMASGTRGFGALGAQRQAMANTAQARQGLAGQIATAIGQQRAADQARAQAGLAQLIGEEERSAYALDEFQRANARPGFLPTLTTLAGAGLGAYFGPEGMRAGGAAGGAIGNATLRSYGR